MLYIHGYDVLTAMIISHILSTLIDNCFMLIPWGSWAGQHYNLIAHLPYDNVMCYISPGPVTDTPNGGQHPGTHLMITHGIIPLLHLGWGYTGAATTCIRYWYIQDASTHTQTCIHATAAGSIYICCNYLGDYPNTPPPNVCITHNIFLWFIYTYSNHMYMYITSAWSIYIVHTCTKM